MKNKHKQQNNGKLLLTFMLISLVIGLIEAATDKISPKIALAEEKIAKTIQYSEKILSCAGEPCVASGEALAIEQQPQDVVVEKIVEPQHIVLEAVNTEFSPEQVEQEIRKIAAELHFKWPDYLVRLALCESRLDPKAINRNGNNPTYSYDRGLFQFNSYWQRKVSDECAYSIDCSTRKTIEMINAGNQHLWACDEIVLNK